MALDINDKNFEELVEKSGKVALLDFWAEWCGPCREVAPYIDEVFEKHQETAVIGKVNIEDSPMIAGRFRVRNIPTVLVLKDGQIVEKIVGKSAKKEYFEAIEKHL